MSEQQSGSSLDGVRVWNTGAASQQQDAQPGYEHTIHDSSAFEPTAQIGGQQAFDGGQQTYGDSQQAAFGTSQGQPGSTGFEQGTAAAGAGQQGPGSGWQPTADPTAAPTVDPTVDPAVAGAAYTTTPSTGATAARPRKRFPSTLVAATVGVAILGAGGAATVQAIASDGHPAQTQSERGPGGMRGGTGRFGQSGTQTDGAPGSGTQANGAQGNGTQGNGTQGNGTQGNGGPAMGQQGTQQQGTQQQGTQQQGTQQQGQPPAMGNQQNGQTQTGS